MALLEMCSTSAQNQSIEPEAKGAKLSCIVCRTRPSCVLLPEACLKRYNASVVLQYKSWPALHAFPSSQTALHAKQGRESSFRVLGHRAFVGLHAGIRFV